MADFNLTDNDDTKDEWLTPPSLIQALGEFDLDPCAPVVRPWKTARDHFTIEDDGLAQPWHGRVWCNPPYGRQTFIWLEKLAHHREGGIALIFARTETTGFHKQIWQKAHSVFFFEGRLKFHHVDGSLADNGANAPSCLVAYSPADTIAIAGAAALEFIKGKLVTL